MLPSSGMSGVVLDDSGKPVAHARVEAWVSGPGGAQARTTSDDHGRFAFGLPPGSYSVRADTDSGYIGPIAVTLEPDRRVDDLTLQLPPNMFQSNLGKFPELRMHVRAVLDDASPSRSSRCTTHSGTSAPPPISDAGGRGPHRVERRLVAERVDWSARRAVAEAAAAGEPVVAEVLGDRLRAAVERRHHVRLARAGAARAG